MDPVDVGSSAQCIVDFESSSVDPVDVGGSAQCIVDLSHHQWIL